MFTSRKGTWSPDICSRSPFSAKILWRCKAIFQFCRGPFSGWTFSRWGKTALWSKFTKLSS